MSIFDVLRCLFSVCLVLSASQAHAFTVGYFLFEPHAMVVDGKPTGAAVEYFRDYIAPEMGLNNVEFQGPVPFGRLLRNFREGEYDAILLLVRTLDRTRQFRFPKAAYGTMESAVLTSKDFPWDRVSSPEQLKGIIIGYTEKAWRPEPMKESCLQFDMVAARSATILNFRKFDQGRLDAIYSPDGAALQYRLEHEKMSRPCKIIPISGTTEDIYTVFHPGVDPALVRNYERALGKVRSRVSYASVVKRYLRESKDHK